MSNAPRKPGTALGELSGEEKSIEIDGETFALKPRLKLKAIAAIQTMDIDGFASRAIADPKQAEAFAEALEVESLDEVLALYGFDGVGESLASLKS